MRSMTHLALMMALALPAASGSSLLPWHGKGILSGCDSSGGTFSVEADDHVSLPFVVEGSAVPDGTLEVREVGGSDSSGSLQVTIKGPFTVTGDLGPLLANETRGLRVHYSGLSAAPTIQNGTVTISVDGQSVDADLAAVIGDSALPAATWSSNQYGARATLPLPSAPYPGKGSPYSDVLLFLPDGYSDQGDLNVVTHLHGFNATLSATVPRQKLVEQHALSGRDALLIIPQGPYNTSSGDFGQLMDPGGYANLVRDAVSVLYRDGFIERPVLGDIALTSHSGGYQATAAIIQQGGLPIHAVHLFDSLYADESVFEDFALAGGILRSSYTASGGTDDNNAAFKATLLADGLTVSTSFDDDALLANAITIGSSPASHDGCISEERSFARWLSASGLRRHPSAPPELRQVSSNGSTALVSWLADAGSSPLNYVVQGSTDGTTWTNLAETTSLSATVSARPWLRLLVNDPVFGLSDPSDVYGGSGSGWLVVDGFDRVLGGSYSYFTHNFGGLVGNALGTAFSTASNEAVARGQVKLSSYTGVLWLLGDESVDDVTFDAAEKSALDAYVAGGGRLIVSGAEVGYATSSSWLSSTLHATYVKDDAATTHAGGYTFGVTYPEDYPDVLSGQTTLWSYDTGGAAAVGYNHQIIVVGFPLETLSSTDLKPAIQALVAWLN